MILKGSQRSGASQLAAHLLSIDQNEHMELHELRGFVADDLHGAFQEIHAISRGTRCKQFMFSLSLNPPSQETVSIEAFEDAIEATEEKLGLHGQPRAIVFHEKEGPGGLRRHAHCVWSRIDSQTMTAINLPHYKMKLQDVSRSLYLQHGWEMPNGLKDRRDRDPFNFTHAEWEQAKRAGRDPRAIKQTIRECWANSQAKDDFVGALSRQGFSLARGDRRGIVAVDHLGEVYSLNRATGARAKEIKARLGEPENFPALADVRAEISQRMTSTLERLALQEQKRFKQATAKLDQRKALIVERQRAERAALKQRQAERWAQETAARTARFSRGFRGLWDRLTGKHAQLRRQNEAESQRALERDRAEKNAIIKQHLAERRKQLSQTRNRRSAHSKRLQALYDDVTKYRQMQQSTAPKRSERPSKSPRDRPSTTRTGPDLER